MARLALYLLGPPRLEQDGEPVQIKRRKVTALLAYLAVTGQPHSREALATLLSPEFDTSRARNELRRTLSVLNRLLGTGCLTVDRETVSLDANADPSSGSGQGLWLDVDRFCRTLAACDTHDHPADAACPDCVPRLEGAVELYQDDFLAGFSLPDSLAFEEWQFFQSEGLRDQLARALQRLVRWHSELEEYESAIAYARRWLALDPLHEPAHRQLMALYAQADRRGAALRQYRTCLRTLEEELSVPPAPETTALYEQLRAARARPALREVTTSSRPQVGAAHLPTFLVPEEAPAEVEQDVFVTRERELAQLENYLNSALAGRGQVVFVTGGPGRGKTALMSEFARRAMEAHSDLLVATGNCNAYSGVGDPYLPFRQVIQRLTGEVESSWAAGAVTREHAQRLWAALPQAIQALLDHGVSLIDIFLPGASLLSRAATAALPPGGTQAADDAGWLEQLRDAIQREKPDPGSGSTHRPSKLGGARELAEVLTQSQLFEGYTQMLGALATQHPLLLILDDLQWTDSASVSLLFHLGRELGSGRILIVGAYRAEEVALGRDGERHPLEKVLAEFKRGFGDVWLDLTQADQTEGRRFVEAFLDSESNCLGEDFRTTLFRCTGGHPLFTVELLRAMQERGDLIRDGEGHWVQSPALDWERLPPRVEAVIEERLGRLEQRLWDILALASVEGGEFTAQVVSRLGDIPERELLRALSQELGARHRLVRELEEVRVGGRFLARYQFTHALFQGYLYDALSAGERWLLHGEVAGTLEELYAGHIEEITVQLAHHYAAAGPAEKAIDYLLRAGDQARMAYAHQEAIDYYRRALAFLQQQDAYERGARTLMKLGLTYHDALNFRQAREAYAEGFALWQLAGELQATTLPSPAPHALRVAWSPPWTLDPTMAFDDASFTVIDQLFCGLMERSPEMEVLPGVARSWEMSQGGHRYLFHLRDDVHWSDGTPVTASDFECAWTRTLDPETGSPAARQLYDVKGAKRFHQGEVSDPTSLGVRALDSTTLVVELERPTGYFLHLLTQSVTYPVPRHVVEVYGSAWTELRTIVTNGPFNLESWQESESAVLVRNPEYHGPFNGNVQRVELLFSASGSTRLAAYETGHLDIANLTGASPAEMDRARRRHAGEVVSVSDPATYYAGFNVDRPPFDDPRVRLAFVLATDRERLADVVLRGDVLPATGGFVPPGVPGHSSGIGLPYDRDRASLLLAKAGYPGGRGFPVVDLQGWHSTETYSEYLQTQWSQNLGVRITVETAEWATYHEKIRKERPHVFFLSWIADYPDPDSFLRVGLERMWNLVNVRWQNPAYEKLVEQASQVTDQAERLNLYQQADRILVEKAAIMPLAYSRLHLAVKPWVTRLPMAMAKDVFWKDVIIEPH